MVQSIEQNQKKITNIQDLISNREERHQKIQLWSNLYEREYALRLAIAAADDHSEDLLAKTDPNAKYTHIVAESDYFEDFREGWEYTLRHFIEQYKEAAQQHPKEECHAMLRNTGARHAANIINHGSYESVYKTICLTVNIVEFDVF
jgi:hypothetical protein